MYLNLSRWSTDSGIDKIRQLFIDAYGTRMWGLVMEEYYLSTSPHKNKLMIKVTLMLRFTIDSDGSYRDYNIIELNYPAIDNIIDIQQWRMDVGEVKGKVYDIDNKDYVNISATNDVQLYNTLLAIMDESLDENKEFTKIRYNIEYAIKIMTN